MGSLADKYRAKPSLAAKYRVEAEVPAPVDEPSPLAPSEPVGAAMRGLHQGGSLGFGDEMMGALDTQQELSKRMRQGVGLEAPDTSEAIPEINPNGPEIRKSWGPAQPAGKLPVIPGDDSPAPKPDLAEVYRKARDGYRADNKASQKAQPLTYGAGELAGGFAVPMPGAGLAKGAPLVAKMGLGAAQAGGLGLVYGAGNSEADLTKGDAAGVEKDALRSGAVAAPFGAAGAVVGHGLNKLGERFGGKAATAKANLSASNEAEKVASAKGSYGHAVQDTNRTLENLRNAVADPAIPQMDRQNIIAFLDSDAGKALARQVAMNSLENAPGKMSQMASAKAALAAAPAEAAKETADYLGKSTLKADVLPRALHYGKPAVASALGGVAGGPLGAAAGGLLGVAAGKPGRAVSNLVKEPRFQIQLNELLASLSDDAARAVVRGGATAGRKSVDERFGP